MRVAETIKLLDEATRRTCQAQGISVESARVEASILEPSEAMALIGLDADTFAEWAELQVREMTRVAGRITDPWGLLMGILASGVHLSYQLALIREEGSDDTA